MSTMISVSSWLRGMVAARPVLARRERQERPRNDGMEKRIATGLKFAEIIAEIDSSLVV